MLSEQFPGPGVLILAMETDQERVLADSGGSPQSIPNPSVRSSGPTDSRNREQTGYFEVAGDHLYTVLHEAPSPLARVLLVSPFASERSRAYLPLVRWARYLALHGVEVLRFDHRGVGESTGEFERFSFSDWMDDVTQLSAWMQKRTPKIPFVLHGLGVGAILAGKAFHEGIGDGLLLWAPPANANVVLHSALMNWVTLQKFLKSVDERKPLAHYLGQLEIEGRVEVNGYLWSLDLWRESFSVELPPSLCAQVTATAAYNKPVKIVSLGREAVPLVRGGITGYEESNDLNWLYSAGFEWMGSTFNFPQEYGR